eukprot:PhF_6_TR13712/c0_g1_i2/m.22167
MFGGVVLSQDMSGSGTGLLQTLTSFDDLPMSECDPHLLNDAFPIPTTTATTTSQQHVVPPNPNIVTGNTFTTSNTTGGGARNAVEGGVYCPASTARISRSHSMATAVSRGESRSPISPQKSLAPRRCGGGESKIEDDVARPNLQPPPAAAVVTISDFERLWDELRGTHAALIVLQARVKVLEEDAQTNQKAHEARVAQLEAKVQHLTDNTMTRAPTTTQQSVTTTSSIVQSAVKRSRSTPSPSPYHLALRGASEETKRNVSRIVKAFGGTVVDDISRNTNVLVVCGPSTARAERNTKSLLALAYGVPIVTEEFLQSCKEDHELRSVSPSSYVCTEIPNAGVSRRDALQQYFEGKTYGFCESSIVPGVPEFSKLLSALGATVKDHSTPGKRKGNTWLLGLDFIVVKGGNSLINTSSNTIESSALEAMLKTQQTSFASINVVTDEMLKESLWSGKWCGTVKVVDVGDRKTTQPSTAAPNVVASPQPQPRPSPQRHPLKLINTSTSSLPEDPLPPPQILVPQTATYDNPLVLGRHQSCSIVMPLVGISRRHVAIWYVSPTTIGIRDLGSTNGFFVNNVKKLEALVGSGDEIVLGGGGMVAEGQRVTEEMTLQYAAKYIFP